MSQAYLLVLFMTAIYAILCVVFFGHNTDHPKLSIDPENFGDFFTALFSLWQISTGDDWSLIVRPLFEKTGQPMLVAIFFVSFQLCITFTMINVFVCVLVDEFSGAGGLGGEEVLAPHVDMPERQSKFIALLSRLANCLDLEHFDASVDDIWVRVSK
ncbi:hypothetical protein T484DRAFT_2325051 [Baffinella frigidus]|nr:hypothetical protein T484DRAFT_2325051 [Cryptophyta sp. CCMP2293]